MRYGIISDIHANLQALKVAVDSLRADGIDSLICPGDVVGYGPRPNECVDLVAGLGVTTVAGNHDLVAVGKLDGARLNPLARRVMDWTADVLTEDVRGFLTDLPPHAQVGDLIVAHGSLASSETYTKQPAQAKAEIHQARTNFGASTLLLGHTHRAWVVSETGEEVAVWPRGDVRLVPELAYLLNPGSVGQSRERRPDVRFAVVDTETRTASFRARPYDHQATVRELIAAGLPPEACHIKPRPRGILKQTRRRLLGR